MNKYDAIVVGAGNGGLIAACRLQKSGKKTLLIEKHNIPGGFATSFIRGRFEFEGSLHELCDYGDEEHPGNVYKLFQELGITDLEMLPVPDAYRVYDKSTKKDYTMPFGLDAFTDKMEEYVPGSRESIQIFFALAKETKEALAYLSEAKGKPDTKVLQSKYGNFMRIAAHDVHTVLNAIYMPKKAQEILTTYWVYLGSPSKKFSFVHFAVMVLNYIDLKAYIPKNRSHDISITLANKFLELGGEIRYSTEVTKILTENHAVVGVEVTNKDTFYADHIIFNGNPNNVYAYMLPKEEIPASELKLTNVRELGARGVNIFLGLNQSAKEIGLNDYTYFVYDSLDSNAEFERMKNLNEANSVTICLNNAIPDASPEGTCILMMTSLYFSDCFTKTVTKDNYYALKDSIAENLIANFEEVTGIRIKEYIEEIEIATPLTYAHYTNAPEGTIYGYQADGYDNLMPRLMNMYTESSIKGLRFCGGSSLRLSGYSSAYLSGDTAAALTLMDMKEDAR